MISTFAQLWQNAYVRAAVFLLAGYALYWFLKATSFVWTSLLIAYTLAFLTQPIVRHLEKAGWPRWAGVLVALLLLLTVLAGLSFLAAQVVVELAAFVADVPALIASLQALPERFSLLVSNDVEQLLGENIGTAQSVLRPVAESIGEWLRENGARVVRSIFGLVGGLFQLAFVLFLTTYLLAGFQQLSEAFLDAFPPRYRGPTREFLSEVGTVVGGYARAQVGIALLVGASVWIGLHGLGVPLAAALGALAGLGNLVPFLGPFIAGVPAVLLALTESWGRAAAVTLLLIGINLIDGNLISPLVLSRTIHVHPITVIIAVAVGLDLFGLWGGVVGCTSGGPLLGAAKPVVHGLLSRESLVPEAQVKALPPSTAPAIPAQRLRGFLKERRQAIRE